MAENQKTAESIIREIAAALNLSIRAFALGMNQPYSRIFDIANGKTITLSKQVTDAIKTTYKVNESFLLTGRGAMFCDDNQNAPTLDDDVAASFVKVVSAYSNENTRLKAEITELRATINTLNKHIEELEANIGRNIGQDLIV